MEQFVKNAWKEVQYFLVHSLLTEFNSNTPKIYENRYTKWAFLYVHSRTWTNFLYNIIDSSEADNTLSPMKTAWYPSSKLTLLSW